MLNRENGNMHGNTRLFLEEKKVTRTLLPREPHWWFLFDALKYFLRVEVLVKRLATLMWIPQKEIEKL